jgi:uncharacterized membrane protein YhaH (DUF805 family)
MNFGEAIQSGFCKYIVADGRACRSEYWYWCLFTALVGIAAAFIGIGMGTPVDTAVEEQGALEIIANVILFLPSMTVWIRRMHDIEKSGWWFLIAFTIIGVIPLVIWTARKGSAGTNRYGDDPLAMPVAPAPPTVSG